MEQKLFLLLIFLLFSIFVNNKEFPEEKCISDPYYHSKTYLMTIGWSKPNTNVASFFVDYNISKDTDFNDFLEKLKDDILDDTTNKSTEYLVALALFFVLTFIVGIISICGCLWSCQICCCCYGCCCCCCAPDKTSEPKKYCVITSRIFLACFALTVLGFGIVGCIHGYSTFSPSSIIDLMFGVIDFVLFIFQNIVQLGLVIIGFVFSAIYGLISGLIKTYTTSNGGNPMVDVSNIINGIGDVYGNASIVLPNSTSFRNSLENVYDIINSIPDSNYFNGMTDTINELTGISKLGGDYHHIKLRKMYYKAYYGVDMLQSTMISDDINIKYGQLDNAYCWSSISRISSFNNKYVEEYNSFIKDFPTETNVDKVRLENLIIVTEKQLENIAKIKYPCPKPISQTIEVSKDIVQDMEILHKNTTTSLDDGIIQLEKIIGSLSILSDESIDEINTNVSYIVKLVSELNITEIFSFIPSSEDLSRIFTPLYLAIDSIENLTTKLDLGYQREIIDLNNTLNDVTDTIEELKTKVKDQFDILNETINDLKIDEVIDQLKSLNVGEVTKLKSNLNQIKLLSSLYDKGLSIEVLTQKTITIGESFTKITSDLSTSFGESKTKLVIQLNNIYSYLKSLSTKKSDATTEEINSEYQHSLREKSEIDIKLFDDFISSGQKIFNIIDKNELNELKSSVGKSCDNIMDMNLLNTNKENSTNFTCGYLVYKLISPMKYHSYDVMYDLLTKLSDATTKINTDGAGNATEGIRKVLEMTEYTDYFREVEGYSKYLDYIQNPYLALELNENETDTYKQFMYNITKDFETVKKFIQNIGEMFHPDNSRVDFSKFRNIKTNSVRSFINSFEDAFDQIYQLIPDRDRFSINTLVSNSVEDISLDEIINLLDNLGSSEKLIEGLSSILRNKNISGGRSPLDKYDGGSVIVDKNGNDRQNKICLLKECIINSIDLIMKLDFTEFDKIKVEDDGDEDDNSDDSDEYQEHRNYKLNMASFSNKYPNLYIEKTKSKSNNNNINNNIRKQTSFFSSFSYVKGDSGLGFTLPYNVLTSFSLTPLFIALFVVLFTLCVMFCKSPCCINCCSCLNCTTFCCFGSCVYIASAILMLIFFVITDVLSSLPDMMTQYKNFVDFDSEYSLYSRNNYSLVMNIEDIIVNIGERCPNTNGDPTNFWTSFVSGIVNDKDELTRLFKEEISNGEMNDNAVNNITTVISENLNETIINLSNDIANIINCNFISTFIFKLQSNLCSFFKFFFLTSSMWWMCTIFYAIFACYICSKRTLVHNAIYNRELKLLLNESGQFDAIRVDDPSQDLPQPVPIPPSVVVPAPYTVPNGSDLPSDFQYQYYKPMSPQPIMIGTSLPQQNGVNNANNNNFQSNIKINDEPVI